MTITQREWETDLNAPAPGVLGNDLLGIATNLSAILVAGPTNGSVKA